MRFREEIVQYEGKVHFFPPVSRTRIQKGFLVSVQMAKSCRAVLGSRIWPQLITNILTTVCVLEL
jgi:hypothetical protein